MGFFSRKKKTEKRAQALDYAHIPLINGSSRSTDAANATAFLCEKLIIDAISSIPLNLYQRKKDGSRVKAGWHPLYQVAKYSPNSDEPPVLFYSTMVRDYFRGNVYLRKVLVDGLVSSLFLLDPGKVDIRREGGRKIFTYEGQRLTSDDILHIPAKWTYDGLKGSSIRTILESVLQAGNALDEYTQKSFGGFIGKRLVLKLLSLTENLTDEQIQRKQDVFAGKYGGAANADKALMQFPGTEYGVLDTGTVDERVKWLKENADFQDGRVAKVYGVPLPLINGTYQNNIEAIFTVFIETGIRPACTHFAQAFDTLLTPAERETMYFEHDYNSLNKTDLTARIDAYTKQIGNGLLSINEAREKENLPSIGPVGDYRFVPANLMPLTEENIAAYMAKNKEALTGQGDDKK